MIADIHETTLGVLRRLNATPINSWSVIYQALMQQITDRGLGEYTQIYTVKNDIISEVDTTPYEAIYAVKPSKVLGYYVVDDECKAVLIQRWYVPDRTS